MWTLYQIVFFIAFVLCMPTVIIFISAFEPMLYPIIIMLVFIQILAVNRFAIVFRERNIPDVPALVLIQKQLSFQQNPLQCAICLDLMTESQAVTVLPCQHWFHNECITDWLKQKQICPYKCEPHHGVIV